MALQPSRGEIWLADSDPVRGHEQAGQRLVLVVSSNGLNHGPAKIVFVLPLTRTARQNPFFIPLEPPEGGVRDRSYIICNALRAVSTRGSADKPGGWRVMRPWRCLKLACACCWSIETRDTNKLNTYSNALN